MIEDIRKTLWATADKLRANMDAAEYKHLVLGLIFVKYISDTFQAKRAELTARFADPADEYFLDGSTPETLATELEDRDYYREVNVFWVPEAARWEQLRAAAKQTDIGKRIDEALSVIEAENPKLKGILDKRFARAQLPDGKLGELVDLVSTIGFGASAREARDVLGVVYEYFLGMFASAEGKRGGQFYTPRSIVKTLVAVLAPHHGKVYDPCCGSGGMFVQSEEFIEAHGGKLGDVAIFGQEANPTTWRLAAMNLAIRGIDFNLGREPADSFTKDQFPDLRADFVLANPPFRKGDTVGADRAGRNIKPEYVVQNGDVLFSWSGSREVEVWCGGEGALNQHLFKVTSESVPKWFCLRWTRHHLPHFRRIAASKATTMGHIQRVHLTESKVLVPSTKLLSEMDACFAPLLARTIENEMQAQTLATLRDTLLPRLISGQLRLPEAEALAPG